MAKNVLIKKASLLKITKKRRVVKRLFLAYWIILIPLVLLLIAFYYFILKDLPSPTKLSSGTIPQSSQIYDRNNTLLYTIYAQRNQQFVPLKDIPKSIQQATIAIEDREFYKHGAIDIRGIARAFYATVFKKDLQGGSTLTQQLVKTSLLTPERTIQRKVKEVILAFATEALYPKDKILEMYLNQVPYGGTAYGVEAASQMYFGKHAKELDLAEAALLAGLPESPTAYSPFGARPELARSRQREILSAMQEQGYITSKERDAALKKELTYQEITNPIKAPHFVLFVKDLLVQKYGEQVVDEGGLQVKTSLDLDLQEFAQLGVASEVAKLKSARVGNGAAVITHPGTGEILAMVGSKDYFNIEEDGNVNVALAFRQPGSSIKPINYAVGLIKGFTAATPFVDEATCFPGNPQYCPRNYDGKFHGPVQMRFALANSYNIPAVQMLKLNTVESMMATASAMGIKTFTDPSRYGLSLTLGGGEVTMLDMATAFGVFANRGYRVDLHPILEVKDRTGRVLEKYTPPKSAIFGKKVIPPAVAFIISHMLLDNGARSQAFGSNSALRIGDQPISVKTGTTNDYKDNWTIGYSTQYLVAAWVGNNDGSAMGNIVSGVTGAAPIWHTIMESLHKDKKAEWPKQPGDVVGRNICATSGLLAPPEGTPDRCPTRFEYFMRGTEPKITDPGRTKVFIDKGTNDLAKSGQTENVEERMEVIVTDPLNNRYCLSCPHPTPTPSPTP